MDYKIVRWGERDRLASLHPLVEERGAELHSPDFPLPPDKIPDDFPFLFYVTDENRIVAVRKAMPDLAWTGDRFETWAWAFDTFVEPDYRGKRIGSKLIKLQVDAVEKAGATSGAAYSAIPVLKAYQRVDFSVLGHVPKMCLVRRSRPYIARKIKAAGLLRVMAALTDAAIGTLRRLTRLSGRGPSCRVSAIDEQRYAQAFKAHAIRKQRYYWGDGPGWALSRCSDRDTLYEVSDQDGSSRALMIVRETRDYHDAAERPVDQPRRIVLVDFTLTASDGANYIAKAMANLVDRHDADAADVVTSLPELQNALRANGFRGRGTGMSFAFRPAPGSEHLRETDLADWHLTQFASDGFRLV